MSSFIDFSTKNIFHIQNYYYDWLGFIVRIKVVVPKLDRLLDCIREYLTHGIYVLEDQFQAILHILNLPIKVSKIVVSV
jgi:hypothetical protein